MALVDRLRSIDVPEGYVENVATELAKLDPREAASLESFYEPISNGELLAELDLRFGPDGKEPLSVEVEGSAEPEAPAAPAAPAGSTTEEQVAPGVGVTPGASQPAA